MLSIHMHTGKIHNPAHAQAVHDFPPQVYKPSGGWQAFLLILSVLLGGFSAAGVWYFGTMHGVSSVREATWMVGICLIFLILSCALVALLFRSRVILNPDSVESRELFSTGRLLRTDIRGYRLQQNPRGPASLVLVPRDSPSKKLKFATFYNFDATFWNWMESLPDLDQEDQRAAQREMLENPEIGATPQDRLEAVKNARRLATFMAVAAWAVCAWGWFYPEPYWLAIVLLIILPWLAVAITMRSGGLFRIDAKKNDPHPTVAIPFIMPGFILMLRAVSDVNLLEWRTVTYVSLLLAFALAAAAIAADHSLKRQKGTMLTIILLTIAYGYGATMEANTIFDRSDTAVFSAQIVSKQVVSGRSTSYNLYLAPWGPQKETSKVSVSRRWYESLKPGDTICPTLREGALHIRRYTVHPCPQP